MHQNVLDDINITQFKLINGDDIIAYIMEPTEHGYWVETPLKAVVNPLEAGASQEILFTRYLGLCSNTKAFFIPINTIVMQGVCDDDIKLKYIKMAVGKATIDEALSDDEYVEADSDDLPDESTTFH